MEQHHPKRHFRPSEWPQDQDALPAAGGSSFPGAPRPERGAAMVEFALVVGVFLIFILGFFELCRYFTAEAILIKASQEGMRVAITRQGIGADTRTRPEPAYDTAL